MKSTIEPTGISASICSNTPFAEMFCVSPARLPVFDFTATGSFIGNRAALCMSVYGLRRGGFCEFGCAIISFDAPGDSACLTLPGPSADWPFLGISNEAYTPESGVQSYGSHETSGHKCLGITELRENWSRGGREKVERFRVTCQWSNAKCSLLSTVRACWTPFVVRKCVVAPRTSSLP